MKNWNCICKTNEMVKYGNVFEYTIYYDDIIEHEWCFQFSDYDACEIFFDIPIDYCLFCGRKLETKEVEDNV